MAEPTPAASSAAAITPLEQEVLDEYTQLLSNLNKVRKPPTGLYKPYFICRCAVSRGDCSADLKRLC